MSLSLTRLDRVALTNNPPAQSSGAWNGDYYVHPLAENIAPHLDFFKRDGKTLTLLPHTPDMTFAGNAEAVAWNGNILAVGHDRTSGAPSGLTLFRLDGDSLVKIPGPVEYPNGRVTNLSWSGNYLAVGHWAAAERITLYRLDGETLVKCGPVDIVPHITPNTGALKWNGDYLLAGFSTAPFQKLYKRTGDTLSFVKNNEETEVLRIFHLEWNANYYVACQSAQADLWLFDPTTESFAHQGTRSLSGLSPSITGTAWHDDHLLVSANNIGGSGEAGRYVGLWDSALTVLDAGLVMPNAGGPPGPPAWGDELITIAYYDSLDSAPFLMLYEITDGSIPPGGLTIDGESPQLPFAWPMSGLFSLEGQAPSLSPVSVDNADLTIAGQGTVVAEVVGEPDAYQMVFAGLVPGFEMTGGFELTGTTPGIDGAWTFGDEWFISSTSPHITGSFHGGAHVQGKTPEVAGQFIVEAEVAGYFAGKTATVTGFATGGGFFQGKQGAIAGTWGAEAGDTLNIGSFAGKSPEMGGSIQVIQAGTFAGVAPAAIGDFTGEMEQYGSFTGKTPMPTGLLDATDQITFSFSGRTPVPVFSGGITQDPGLSFSGYTPQINGGAFTASTTSGTAPVPAITEDQIIRYRRGI